jgi:hypothetical protein
VLKPTKNIVTRQAESAQCAYLAMLQVDGTDCNISLDNWDRTHNQYADIDTEINEMQEILTSDWLKSSERIAKHLIGKLKHTDYVFHRNSKEVQKIYNKFNQLNKLLDISDRFTHSDKWQPADIWCIRSNVVIDLSFISSLQELNSWLLDMINEGSILPISLKKNNKTKPNILPVNIDASTNTDLTVEYHGSSISTGKTNWTSSKNTRMLFSRNDKPGIITFRNSSPGAAMNAEVSMQGCNYNLGKLKREAISEIINQYADIQIPDYSLSDIRVRSHQLDQDMIQEVYSLARDIDPSYQIDYQSFKSFINNKATNLNNPDRDWLSSKYQAMLVIKSFRSIPFGKQNQAFQLIFNKAVAMDKLCAPRLEVK